MKHYLITTNPKVFLYLFLSFFVHYGYAQCPAGNVSLTTQADVNAFSSTCLDLNGHLTIGPSTDIVDLSPLQNIVSIAGDLTINNNTILSDLSGLNHAITINGDLAITDNTILSNCNVQSVCDYISTVGNTTFSGNAAAGNCNSIDDIIGIPLATGTVIELDVDGNEVGASTVIDETNNNPYTQSVCSGAGGRLKSVSSSTPTDNCGNNMYFHVNVVGNGALGVISQMQDVSYPFAAALNNTDLYPLVNTTTNTQYVSIKVTPFFDIDGDAAYNSAIDVEGTEIVYNIAVLPTPFVASSNSPVCENDDINLSTDGGTSWNWDGPNGFTSTDQNPVISNAASAQAGTYSVTITSSNGCTNVSTTDVVVNALPTVTIAAISAQCVDETTVSLSGTPMGGTFSGTGVTSTNFDPSTAGVGTHTITYTYTDGNGCTNTATTDVVVNALPTANAGQNQTICENTSTTLTATGGDTYLWSTNETTATITISPTTTTTYTVTVTNSNGCTDTDDVEVAVISNVLPEITGTVEELDAMNNVINGSTTISATNNNPYSVTVCSGQGGSLTNVTTANPVDNCGKPLFVTVNIIGNANLGVATTTTDVPYAQIGAALPASLHPLVNTQSTTQYVSIKAIPFYDVDGSGNQSAGDVIGTEITYTIAVQAAPQAVCQDISVELDNTGNVTISENDIDNGSTAPCGLTSMVITPTSFDCSNIGSNTVTLTITDDSGNTSTCNSTVTVSDHILPVAMEGATIISNFDFMSDFTMEGCGTETMINGLALTGGVPTEIPSTDLPSGLTFTDACGIDKYEYWETQSSSDLCSTNGVHYVRIYKAYDVNGNTTVVKQNLYIKDTTAPTLTNIPNNITVECDNIPTATNVSATDNCDNDVEITMVDDTTNGSCTDNYTIERTWTATDDCGNTATGVQIITVEDTTNPVFDNTPANVTVECNSIPVAATLTATDNCDAAVDVTFSETTTAGSCTFNYVITRTWVASDNCGNTMTHTQTVTVEDTTNPELVGVPTDVTVECSEISTVPTLTATDNCDQNVNIAFSESTAVGTCANESTITRTWTATDVCGNSTIGVQVITVEDTTNPVLVDVPSDITLECDATIPTVATVTATDNCDNAPTVNFTETTAAGTCANESTVTRTWTATDACGNSAVGTQVITIEDTTNPVLVDVPSDITLECDATIPTVATVTATDNCDNAVMVSFVETTAVGSCTDASEITRTWTATDACGNSAIGIQVITIEDTTNPVFASIPTDITVECDNIPAVATVTATDNCDNDVLVSLNEVVSNQSCDNTYTLTRTWTATDNCGNTAVGVQVITIEDTTNPVFTNIPTDVTVECDNIPSMETVMATDNCDADVSILSNETRTDGSCADDYTLTRTWTATDNCGNTNSISQVITVNDTTDPVFTTVPNDITIECTSNIVFGTPVFEDNCDTNVDITFVDAQDPNANCAGGTHTRTWTIEDNCGNTKSASQIITLEDTTNPVISTNAIDETVTCDGSGNTAELNTWLANNGGATATDACGTETWSNNYTSQDADGSTEVVFTVTDACGNTNTTTASFIVDPIKPENAVGYAVCKDGTVPAGEGLQADCTTCTGAMSVKWFSTATSTTELAMGSPFDPTGQIAEEGMVDLSTVGTYTFYAECNCVGCPSERVAVELKVTEPIDMIGLTTSVESICQGTTANPNISFDLFVDILAGTGPYTVEYTDGINNYTVNNYMSGDAIPITTMAMIPQGQSYVELNYAVTNITGGCVTMNLAAQATVTIVDCENVPLDNYELIDPCQCMDNATTLTDGQFDESITLSAPAGQNWTVQSVSGLYLTTSAAPPTAPNPVTVGMAFTETAIPSTTIPGAVIYELKGIHVDGVGYTMTAENTTLGVVTTTVSNTCYYPNPEILDFPDVICNNNIYEIPFLGRADRGDGSGYVAADNEIFEIVNSSGAVVYGPVAGGTFDPSSLPIGDYTVAYTFDAPDEAHGPAVGYPGCSQTVSKAFNIINCNTCTGGDCPYYLVLKDSGQNGWEGAKLTVTLNEAMPGTAYTITTAEGGLKIVQLCINSGGFIDLQYDEGGNNPEHSWYLVNSLGTIVNDMSGHPVNYVGSHTQPIRVKAQCPTSTCENTTANFTVRVTMGPHPEAQSWEITRFDGTRVLHLNADAYAGLAPGSQMEHTVELDLCEAYTITLQAADNGVFSAGGVWELISDNVDYGTQILNSGDAYYGSSQLMNVDFPNLAADVIRPFTIPCKANCPDDIVSTDIITPINGTCYNNVSIPLVQPEICYPYRNHGLGCTITENVYYLENGLPYQSTNLTQVFEGGGIDPTDATMIANWDDFTNHYGMKIPVGCHKLVYELTYCDGIITKCTTDLIVVSETNPVVTGNDNVHISLAKPDQDPTNGGWDQGYADDYGECVIKVLADMVLEMPTSCVDDFNSEFTITLKDADGNLIIQYGQDGLPLDAAGNSIPPALSNVIEAAHDLIGPAQVGQTLTYIVEHKYSHSKTWGHILVEDKTAPEIVCHDYDLQCTHPYALDENYTHTEILTPPASEMPANIAGGTAGVQSNTWIPVNVECAMVGEVIQEVCVNLEVSHTMYQDLTFVLHSPTAMGIAPIVMNSVGATNEFCFTDFNGKACKDAESSVSDVVVLENVGSQKPGLYGKTWYLEVIDNRATGTVFGGGEIPVASLSLKCGFPTPYDVYDCTLQTVTLIDESINETLCDQSDWNGAYIERTWQAIDAYGNSSTCTQRVNLKAPPLSEVNLPEDIVLECDGVLTPETTIPTVSGEFSFGCNTPFSSAVEDAHGLCDFTYTYSDKVFWTCHNSYSIERTWTYGNWCTSVYKTHVQIIDVKDTTPPEIALDTIHVSTGNDCTADVTIDISGITDGCSQIQSITGVYSGVGKVYNPNGIKHYVDLLTERLTGLPLGVTEVNVIAKDSCLNESSKLVVIIVEDKTAPNATCHDQLNTGIVQVDDNGNARISASQIGVGSSDNCSDVTLQIRRLDGCLGQSEYGEFVYFECCDAGDTISIQLLVTDEAGNTNTCTSSVFVQGTGEFGIVSVPDDITLECGSDLPVVDTTQVVLNSICNSLENIQITTRDSVIKSDLCNLPIQVDRTWIVSNADTSYTKVQHIYYNLVDAFTVDFPEDITLTGCPDTVPTNAGRPIITSAAKCSQISINLEDQLFEINGSNGACYYLKRIWTIHNDCVYSPTNANTDLGIEIDPNAHIYKDDGDGYFQYTQIINVIDTEAPIVNCPDTLVYLDTLGVTNTCSMNVKLEVDASDACTGFEYLTYMYQLDLNDDGTIDESGEATGGFVERELEYGTHSITWMVSDGCGNMSMCTTIIDVRDAKKPSPVCISLAVPLMDLGSNKTIRIFATDLLKYATDNCTDSTELRNSVRIKRAGTIDDPSRKILFDCDDIGAQTIEVWVTDEAGNSEYCTVSIEIQGDCNDVCVGTMTRDTIACGTGGTEGYYCLDVPEADFSNYLIKIDGVEVNAALGGCNPIDKVSYDPDILFDGVLPIILDSILIDGVKYVGSFSTLEQLRDSLNSWDPTSTWSIENSGRLSGGNMDKNYSMMVFHDSNPIGISVKRTTLSPNTNSVNLGSVLGAFTEGSYEILVKGQSQGCPDTIQLTVDCNYTGGRARISGKIETQYEEPIEDVMVYTDKAQTPSAEDGYYVFNNMFMDQSYTLTPVKDIKPLEGVSVSDILVLINHVLGEKLLDDPYTIIAADINKDKIVNVSDIIALRRLLLRIDDDFRKNTSWRFIDRSYQFKNPTKPLGEPYPESINIENLSHDMFLNDFIGVKIGDVNGTLSGFRSDKGLNLATINTEVEAGKIYQVEITSANFTDVEGFIFALGFNTEKLKFNDIKAGILDMSGHSIGTAKLDDGILTCIWTGKEHTVEKDATLFTIEFTAKASGKLGDWIQISNRYIDAEACYSDESCGDVQLGFIDQDGSVLVKSDFRLYQNQPNPFEGYTVIGFELPSDEVATIKIFDVSGRTIKVIQNHYTKGYNEIRVNRNTLNVTGVLYYQLETADNIDTKKMIILK